MYSEKELLFSYYHMHHIRLRCTYKQPMKSRHVICLVYYIGECQTLRVTTIVDPFMAFEIDNKVKWAIYCIY